MSRRLRCAVVGVGYLGRFHAQKYRLLADEGLVELVGVHDARAVRGEEIAKEVSCAHYADYRELFGRIDAVTIASSTITHFPIAQKFLEAGIHVNVEKPMTVTIEEAHELVRLSEEKRLILQVGHVERFNSALKAARAQLVHRPLFIECHRLAPFKPRGVDVDVVLDLMIHDLDVILSLVDSPVLSVSAVGAPVLTQLADIANARLEFASGTVANVTASRVSQSATRKFRVFQQSQYLSIDFGSGEVHLTTKTSPDWPDDLEKAAAEGKLPLKIESWSLEKGDALLDETRAFVKACLGEAPVLISGQDGLKALTLAQKIQTDLYERLRRLA